MATKKIFTDGLLIVGGHDCTDNANQFEFAPTRANVDTTTLGSGGAMEYEPGLVSSTFSAGGFMPASGGDVHDAFDNATVPIVFCDEPSPSDGEIAAVIDIVNGGPQYAGPVGGAAGFTINGQGLGGWGYILGNRSSITSSGTGTEANAGAIAANRKALAVLQVHSGDTGTLDVVVQSDATGFASPTSRATFAQVAAASTPTFEVIEIAGPVTDDYWRDSYTVTGGGTWAFTVSIVIL